MPGAMAVTGKQAQSPGVLKMAEWKERRVFALNIDIHPTWFSVPSIQCPGSDPCFFPLSSILRQ